MTAPGSHEHVDEVPEPTVPRRAPPKGWLRFALVRGLQVFYGLFALLASLFVSLMALNTHLGDGLERAIMTAPFTLGLALLGTSVHRFSVRTVGLTRVERVAAHSFWVMTLIPLAVSIAGALFSLAM